MTANLNSFDPGNPFKPWLFSIALNLYRDRYRKLKRWAGRIRTFFTNEEGDEVLNNIQSTERAPDEQVIYKEQEARLKSCIDSLDDKFRLLLIMYYYSQMSYDQIARTVNIPEGTVKSRLNTAKARLKKLMEVNNNG